MSTKYEGSMYWDVPRDERHLPDCASELADAIDAGKNEAQRHVPVSIQTEPIRVLHAKM
jgi:hypothetical protein